ncbi:MAG: hypothetical protein Fur0042_17820 [Cyanophyceae cyanobacterium]
MADRFALPLEAIVNFAGGEVVLGVPQQFEDEPSLAADAHSEVLATVEGVVEAGDGVHWGGDRGAGAIECWPYPSVWFWWCGLAALGAIKVGRSRSKSLGGCVSITLAAAKSLQLGVLSRRCRITT